MSSPITDWVSYNSRRYPELIAVENLDSGFCLTWAELEGRVARLTGVLVDRLAVRPGDRVGLIAEDDWHVIALQFACIRAGAMFVPFNWRLAQAEIEILGKDAELSVLVHDAVWAASAGALATTFDVPLVGWGGSGGTDLDTLIEAATPVPAPGSYSGDQVAQMLYTSGTTGLPKGALIRLSGLVAHGQNVGVEMHINGPRSRYLSALPLFHAAGLNAITNPVLMTGGRVSILRRFDPKKVAELLGNPANGFTNFNGPPVMYRMTMEKAGPEADFSSLNAAMVGGGAIDPEVGAYFSARGCELQAGWGATEMGPSVTLMPKEDRVRKQHTVGFPVQHLEIRVVDPVTAQDVEPGGIGEAWVRGPSIITGYWRREPEDPQAAAEGWFKSGDAVCIDEDGFVALRGRFKDMYKSGGENVFAAEVERVLSAFEGVQDVAVVGVPHERWGEVGYAVVVARPGYEVTEPDVIAHCARRLAKYKVPHKVVVVNELPRNVTGKIQKNVLRDQLS